jgi:hypothetical protein
MFPIIFVSVFLGLVLLLVLTVYSLGTAIKRQANKPINRFFAPIPRPGSFSLVALEGKVVDVIENVVSWKLEKGEHGDGNEDKRFTLGKKLSGFWERTLGVKWIGLFKTIRVFEDWEWSELQEVENDQKVVTHEIVKRKGNVKEFFYQFSHPVVIDDAEIRDNIRVTITTLITVLHLHPVRAFTLNKNPTELFAAMVKSAIRSCVSNKTFDEVKNMAASASIGQTQSPELWEILKNLNGLEIDKSGNPIYSSENPLGTVGKIGKLIVRGEILQVQAVGDAAAAIEAQKLAELRGQAKIVDAQKIADALVISAQGRMDAAHRDAQAQRQLNEANAGYFASLPGGARMFAAAQVAGTTSKISTWVEGRSDTDVTLPLPIAPPMPPEPERVEPEKEAKPAKKSK